MRLARRVAVLTMAFAALIALAAVEAQTPKYLRCDWPGWTCDEQIQKWLDVIRRESDPAKRRAAWEEVHKRFYEYVPAIRYGDIFGFRAMQAYVKGFNESMTFYRLYNVWLDK